MVAEIAKAAGLQDDQVTHRLRHGLGAAHGIEQNRDEDGVITLVLPDGAPAKAPVAGGATTAAQAQPRFLRRPSSSPMARSLKTASLAAASRRPL